MAPILWQDGALARLKKGETIDKLLYGGYSTISLGYAGLCECVRRMTGVDHTKPEGTKFGLEVMQHLNDACAKWRAETNIDFSLYGTPMESTTYKFAKKLQERFGIIPGVTDASYITNSYHVNVKEEINAFDKLPMESTTYKFAKKLQERFGIIPGVTDASYITNSYHVNVKEEINAFDKLTFESQFQRLSPGGAISYVEVPNMEDNIPAVMALLTHIYDSIMYAELNTKSD